MVKQVLRGGQWRISTEQLKRWLPNAYYYLFYGALGSLFPFLNIYYRSIGLNPWHIGILGGIRPLVALLSGPLWCYVSNRYKIRKFLLLLSLVGWVALTVPIVFVSHAHFGKCPLEDRPFVNISELNTTYASKSSFKRQFNSRIKADVSNEALKLWEHENDERSGNKAEYNVTGNRKHGRQIRSLEKSSDSKNNPRSAVQVGKPLANSFGLMGITFRKNPFKDTRKPYDFRSRGSPYVNKRINSFATTIFIEIFFLVLIGEIFQAPTDDVNIHYGGTFLEPLGVLFQNVPQNGMYSSLGIGGLALFTGILLTFAPKYTICGEKYGDYRIAFSIFAVLMTSALLVSLHFSFTHRRKKISVNVVQSVKELCTLGHLGFWSVVMVMGIFRGVLYNFLYWNIIEIEGSELVVGVTVICQHLSDFIMALSAPILMKYLGYLGMIFCGLTSYSLRFVIYSWLSTPNSAWAIPSVELLQGISHSTTWSAFILYIINYTPRSTYPVGIFVMQGLYLGVGTTLGAMLSGVLIERLDTNVAFRIFGLTSLWVCLIFTLTQPTGVTEILPSDIEPTSNLIEDDEYSSLSEEEQCFDYNRRNVIYIPPKEFVLPSPSAPLIPTFMTYVNKEGHPE